MSEHPAFDPTCLDWEKSAGLLPAVVQDAITGRVLMQAWMDRSAVEKTLESGKVTFFSRSRQQAWTKGETSGHFLQLVSIRADCDNDCLLVTAKPQGPTCHTGTTTCFDGATPATGGILENLATLIARRDVDRPEGSYTTRLLEEGVQRIAQKVGEEGVETALAGVSGSIDELTSESADLLYHLLVLLQARGVKLDAVLEELARRHDPQGTNGTQ